MVMQAWGAYGTLWPVVSQWLGVAPDLGRGSVAVVPQVPAGQTAISGDSIRLGDGGVDVSATRTGSTYTTDVTRHSRLALTIGAVLPDGAKVRRATLDGRPVGVQLVRTARGAEARVMVGAGTGTSSLVVVTR